MGYLCYRIVKNKKYYYLEEAFLFNGKLVKESVYLGAISPSNDELFLAQEILSRTCLEKNHTVLVPPLTEFIRNRTALILERVKVQNKQDKERITLLSKKTQKEFKEKKQNLFLKNISLISTEQAPLNKNLRKCFEYYEKELLENKPVSIEIIHKFYSYLSGKKINEDDKSKALLHLLLKWYVEKDNLIHPVEFSAKFCLKFLSINPFDEYNQIIAHILMNYILEINGFPFIIISKKRKTTYDKAVLAGKTEDYKVFTTLLIEEVVKKNKKGNSQG